MSDVMDLFLFIKRNRESREECKYTVLVSFILFLLNDIKNNLFRYPYVDAEKLNSYLKSSYTEFTKLDTFAEGLKFSKRLFILRAFQNIFKR